MKILSLEATKVFVTLIAGMTEGYLKIENEPYMPLTIEQIGHGVQTDIGIADQYSLCHYYEQNGDLMQDPEMCFLVIDARGEVQDDFYKTLVVPYMYRQAAFNMLQESITIDESNRITECRINQQREHTLFANQWLENIREQGFLDVIKP